MLWSRWSRLSIMRNAWRIRYSIIISPKAIAIFAGDILSNNSRVILHVSQNMETINGLGLHSFVKSSLSILDSLSRTFYNHDILRRIKEYIITKKSRTNGRIKLFKTKASPHYLVIACRLFGVNSSVMSQETKRQCEVILRRTTLQYISLF